MIEKRNAYRWSVGFAVALAACAGGSGGGGGCGGGCSTPLPNGFPRDQRVENAVTVRVTKPGLEFLEQNLPTIASRLGLGGTGGVVNFPIPTSTTTTAGTDITICPGGPTGDKCRADIKLGEAKLRINGVTPNAVVITGTIPVRIKELPIAAVLPGIPGLRPTLNIGVGLGGTGTNGVNAPTCNGSTPVADYTDIPLNISLPLIAETNAPRDGLTKVDFKNAVFDIGIQSDDVVICGNCSFATSLCNSVLGFVKNLVFDLAVGGIKDQLTGTLKQSFCQQADTTATPQCPAGSTKKNDGICYVDADPTQCLPILLGTEGHFNLGKSLQGTSPSTTSELDIILAAGGNMTPDPLTAKSNTPYAGYTPNGLTLTMLSGLKPAPATRCAPIANLPIPRNIPVPAQLKLNEPTNWPAGAAKPHVGIGIAKRYLDHTFGALHDSGLLCLGVTTDTVAQLQTGLLSVLIKSLEYFSIEQKAASVAIQTRPQKPASIAIGNGTDIKTDPHLKLKLEQFAVDFYVMTNERFVRVFTLVADVSVPLNLQITGDGKLKPQLGDLTIANAKVTNSEPLLEDPTKVAESLATILGSLGGQLGGAISPIDLASATASLGVSINIVDGGIRKVTEGTDDFLALFANIGPAAATQPYMIASPKASVRAVHVDAKALEVATFDASRAPSIEIDVDAEGPEATGDLEWLVTVNGAAWSDWSSERHRTVRSPVFLAQGRHTLEVQVRDAKNHARVSQGKAILPVLIDVMAPAARIVTEGGKPSLHVFDVVSGEEAIGARWVDANGIWSEWTTVAAAKTKVAAGEATDVEVRDEAGNLGTSAQGLRGRPDASLAGAASGCGCAVAGTKAGPSHLFGWLAVLPLAMAFRRRRRPVAAAVGVGALAASALVLGAAPGCGGDAGGGEPVKPILCGADCTEECQEPLPQGVLGAYLSTAKAPDGTIWAAAYSDFAVIGTRATNYGDLVVGKYDPAKKTFAWSIVDGLPEARAEGVCTDADPRGWRSGEDESGPNVGLYTSIAFSGSTPIVSYFDLTKKRLRVATQESSGWKSYTLREVSVGEAGRSARMTLVEGKPVIAFAQVEPIDGGKVRSKIVVARAKTDLPASEGDWTFEDTIVDDTTPCRSGWCKSGNVCLKSGLCAASATGCTAACATGQSCVKTGTSPTCEASLGSDQIDSYAPITGAITRIVAGKNGALAVVAYDRPHGNLLVSRYAASKWTTLLVDGETGSRASNNAVDTGDVGLGANGVYAEDGTLWLSYVNGSTEDLRVVSVSPTGTIGTPETVDDGFDASWNDGKHLVGDDSAIVIDSAATLTLAYQDATAGTLRTAVGTTISGGGHRWTKKSSAIAQSTAGFFPSIVSASPLSIAHFVRRADRAERTIVGDVVITNP
jgi:MYXO-CTERM domain-containing protein